MLALVLVDICGNTNQGKNNLKKYMDTTIGMAIINGNSN